MKKSALYCVTVFLVVVTGCSSVKRMDPPPTLYESAQIPHIPEARFWGDQPPPNTEERLNRLRNQIESSGVDKNSDQYFLAISGGGQNGAFGSGLLAGWTASGTRPEFRMVTGISTGSLMAPFAFLGAEYDSVIEQLYTHFSTSDVVDTQFLSGLFSGDAITDSAPLRSILEHYFSIHEMKRIAQEYRRGRRLFVGTTNLDMQRPMIWDIGAIAASGAPEARSLIIDILLASAAIPGAFPPIYFSVEHNGICYDEMHVDGGVTTQVFVSPYSLSLRDTMKKLNLTGNGHIYLIRNGRLSPKIAHVIPKTVPILSQSLSTLLRAQGLSNMEVIYLTAKIENMSYQCAYIPADFSEEPEEFFDSDYMNELFDYAYGLAAAKYPWKTTPPGQYAAP